MVSPSVQRGLLLAFAVVAGGAAGGLVGAIVVAGGVAILGRWPDVQKTVGWTACVVLFGIGVAAHMLATPQTAIAAAPDYADAPRRPTPVTFLQQVNGDIHQCTQNGGRPLTCYVDKTPKRCQQQALALFSNPGSDAQRAWGVCIQSCYGSSDKECRRR